MTWQLFLKKTTKMPELHIIGQIECGYEFPKNSLFCKFKFVADETYWELLEGTKEGQTQVDFPAVF
jgi:hypothetical protein